MKPIIGALVAGSLLAMTHASTASTDASSDIAWRAFSPATFEESRRRGKPVLLNLEAVWCHWCHVMDRTTYADPAVAAVVNEHFVPVKVDHDARPDLANKYRRWGWPATIVIAPGGRELIKKAGYIAPEEMLRMLEGLRTGDTAPVAMTEEKLSPPAANRLTPQLTTELLRRHHKLFDDALGGLKLGKRFLDPDSVEFALVLAGEGDSRSAGRAKKTLAAAAMLVDPEWGGVYQYSTHGDWEHPHYEKLMRTQARYLRIYTLGYLAFGDSAYLAVIDDVARYLNDFLRHPGGAFYVSQDADLVQGTKGHEFFALSAAERRLRGMPRIDRHVYTEANGRAIEGLALASRLPARGDLGTLAERAAEVLLKSHLRDDGAFRHAANSDDGPYLADNLWMARGLVALYENTGEDRWLNAARNAMDYVDLTMRDTAGYVGGVDNGTPVKPAASIDENIGVARLAARLHELTDEVRYRDMFQHAYGYLVDPDVALRRVTEPGILLIAWNIAPALAK